MQSKKICIIGAGEIGNAIFFILKKKGLENIFIWDKDKAKLSHNLSYEECINNTDFLFFCIPSRFVREALLQALPLLNKNVICVYLSKGIEKSSKKFVPQIFEEVLRDTSIQWAGLAGPMLAEEILLNKKASALVASYSKKARNWLRQLFEGSDLKLLPSADPYSVAYASVLKNIYAFALGIAEALDWGDNMKGWLVSMALDEMYSIIDYLNGDPKIVYSLAGLGDLVATGYSCYSSNRTAGAKLVKEGRCSIQGEGVLALPILIDLLGENKISDLVILQSLISIIKDNKHPQEVFKQF